MRLPLEELGIELPSIYGYFGIILVFSLKFYPFMFLLASSSLRTINPSIEEAAEGLGAGPWRRFFGVTLPLVFPAISAGALLTFVLSLADFGTPAIVGGKVRVLVTHRGVEIILAGIGHANADLQPWPPMPTDQR